MAKVGRPLKIASPEKFVELAYLYFDACEADGKLPNVTGLGLACGLSGKEGLREYQSRPKFSAPIKEAKARCEQAIIDRCAAENMPTALAIFMLKNHGWSDRVEFVGKGELNAIRVVIVKPDGDGGG